MPNPGIIYKLLFAIALSAPISALGQEASRLLATGGATQLEGQAGGGIVPWAVLAGYGSTNEFSATAFYSHVALDDFDLDAYGVAASFNNRLEVSLARQELEISSLSLPQRSLRQNIFGVKYRISGDLIYNAAPQVSMGVQYKSHRNFDLPRSVGARRDSDTEVFLSAAKLWLAGVLDRNVFANGTLRYGRSNQLGLLGFGGDRRDSRQLLLEGAAGIFLTRRWALGLEYRQQPDNLTFSEQDDWWTAFVGYFPNKRLSIVAAYADLGTIASQAGQSGAYLSVEYSH